MKSKECLLYENLQRNPKEADLIELFNLVAKGTEARLANWDLNDLGTSALWAELRLQEDRLLVDLYKPDITPIKRVKSGKERLIPFENGVCLQLEPDRVWVPQYISFTAEYCIGKREAMENFKRIAFFEL